MAINSNNNNSKCEGIGCAYKQSCGRYLRPADDNQKWASFYATAGDDCDDFEPVETGEHHDISEY